LLTVWPEAYGAVKINAAATTDNPKSQRLIIDLPNIIHSLLEKIITIAY